MMSQHEQTRIFFRLVDSTGQPFNQTDDTRVTFDHVPDVDDFREAVKAECPNSLSGIYSNRLIVHKNMDALKNKEQPLKSSHFLGGVEDAIIIVLVPSTVIVEFDLS